jgi:hypothetical protein
VTGARRLCSADAVPCFLLPWLLAPGFWVPVSWVPVGACAGRIDAETATSMATSAAAGRVTVRRADRGGVPVLLLGGACESGVCARSGAWGCAGEGAEALAQNNSSV